mgnify:CR=1 FL=1
MLTRTLGTLVQSGVPILQALTIVKETAGNLIVANAVAEIAGQFGWVPEGARWVTIAAPASELLTTVGAFEMRASSR